MLKCLVQVAERHLRTRNQSSRLDLKCRGDFGERMQETFLSPLLKVGY